MKVPAFFLTVCLLALNSCANFRKLGKDLKLLDDSYRVTGIITNADSYPCPVRASVVAWDPSTNKVFSGDRVDLSAGGAFMFLVKSPLHQHVIAYADTNRDGKYNPGEPLWMHRDSSGNAAPVVLNGSQRVAKVQGKLALGEKAPAGLTDAVTRALGDRNVDDVIKRQGFGFAIGEKADLDDPKFASTRGEDGLWTPTTFAIHSGFGVYFLEDYDPARVPVLFIHGAAGSPQDWRLAMEKLDRRRYQPWFYVYPSGMRLEKAADALNEAEKLLHARYGFKRLHVVAHSMGGLVARKFVIRNSIIERRPEINTLITYSSPWGGHEAAAMGVKYAPEVVPSWIDMKQGSDFLDHLYDQRLKGRVNHHLFFSHHASRSAILPPENDGTVSVASQTRKEATADAVEVRGFDEDHISILSSRSALKAGKRALDTANP